MSTQGFNEKELAIFEALIDKEPHNIRELKALFWEIAEAHCGEVYEDGWGIAEIDTQAQSFVRNSVRKLIKKGLVERSARGTFRLTKFGIQAVEESTTVDS
jgi:DNA-binding MarR family transcriptional regulator